MEKAHLRHEKQAVALSSIFASAVMSVCKLAVGLSTGSLGILSEALHSLLDCGATVMTYFAVRVSDKPADDMHPYGHGKVESVAALGETLLLFITSFWIIYEAAQKLYTGKIDVEATWPSVAVIVLCILIDIMRARALRRVALKTRSQALEADALHFSSDVLSSGVVLVGLGFVALGFPMGDPLAAIGVSLFVCRAGWILGRRTIDTLTDTAPRGAAYRIKDIIFSVEGVADVTRVRVRPAGSVFFIDADVAVGRGLSQVKADAIRQRVIEAVSAGMPEAEITITTHPLALDNETVQQHAMAIAAHHNAHVHHITVNRSSDRLFVGFDLEVDERLSIREAHERASRLEADMRAEFGSDTDIETHIEPLQDRGIFGNDAHPEELEKIQALLDSLSRETGDFHHIHKVRARRTGDGLILSFHCRTNPEQTVGEVHGKVDEFERVIHQAYPGIIRIIAHVEPEMKAQDGG